MKANELTDGIYVYFNCFDGSKIIVKVIGFKDNVVYGISECGTHWCPISKTEPIPLTPEILEKNEFKKQREGRFLLEASEDNYWVKFYPKDTNYTRGAYSYIDIVCGCISISEMPIEFLHQLQYALRLCGIEKTIKL